MFESMAAYEYRAESHVTDRLERENAQLKAAIEAQKETIERMRYEHVSEECAVCILNEQSELIEQMAEALKSAKKYECGWNLAAEESLQLYEEWKKCQTNHI